jgi:hypothetical protein
MPRVVGCHEHCTLWERPDAGAGVRLSNNVHCTCLGGSCYQASHGYLLLAAGRADNSLYIPPAEHAPSCLKRYVPVHVPCRIDADDLAKPHRCSLAQPRSDQSTPASTRCPPPTATILASSSARWTSRPRSLSMRIPTDAASSRRASRAMDV